MSYSEYQRHLKSGSDVYQSPEYDQYRNSNSFNQKSMSYNNQGPRISTDRFGNAFQLKSAEQVTNKKTGEILESIYKCYVELGGKLYSIEISPRAKETKSGKEAMWVKVTHKPKQKRASSM